MNYDEPGREYDRELFISEWFDEQGKIDAKKTDISLDDFRQCIFDLGSTQVDMFNLKDKKKWGAFVHQGSDYLGNESSDSSNTYHKYLLVMMPNTIASKLRLSFDAFMKSIFERVIRKKQPIDAELRTEITSAVEYARCNWSNVSWFFQGKNMARMFRLLRTLGQFELVATVLALIGSRQVEKSWRVKNDCLFTPRIMQALALLAVRFGNQLTKDVLFKFIEPVAENLQHICEFIKVID